MRFAAVFLVATTLSIAAPAAAQVSVTAPAAGKESSYRKTTISWAPIPGATSYHLEIDDDPNFGSPEVDVTVAGTSYTLSGQRLKLHGQLSWAAYVRINGTRWNANTFSPSYFTIGEDPRWTGLSPAMGVDSQGRVYIANSRLYSSIWLRTSSDWSSMTRLSLADTVSAGRLNLVVDENDVAHASWIENRPTETGVPYYTNSSTGWNLVRIPGTTGSGCSGGSSVAGGGRIDLFYDVCNKSIERWTTTNGIEFTRTSVPNNNSAGSVSAARDGVGNLYVVSYRYLEEFGVEVVFLQTSADGWIPHEIGLGSSPALAVTSTGERHVLRVPAIRENLQKFQYSNSLRGFQTWTDLTTASAPVFDNDILPLIVDESRHQLHAAIPTWDAGIQLCTASHTGQAVDTGTSWTCASVGNGEAETPDLALGADGTLHVAWSSNQGLAYANSLGSFLATNLTPQVSFGAPSTTAGAVTVPAAISDPDGDDLAGHIHVGRYQPVTSLIEPGTTEPILDGRYTLGNGENAYIYDQRVNLQYRILGTAIWASFLYRNALTLPAQVEVRDGTGPILGGFFIASWDATGVTIVQNGFVPYQKLTFSGALPAEIDISPLPVGAAMVAIGVSDQVTSSFAAKAFTKGSGQTRLLLTKP